jgi:hypothetical protein
MSGAIPPLPNMPSWCGTKLKKHKNNFMIMFTEYRKQMYYDHRIHNNSKRKKTSDIEITILVNINTLT